jgi:hypothetical protein
VNNECFCGAATPRPWLLCIGHQATVIGFDVGHRSCEASKKYLMCSKCIRDLTTLWRRYPGHRFLTEHNWVTEAEANPANFNTLVFEHHNFGIMPPTLNPQTLTT